MDVSFKNKSMIFLWSQRVRLPSYSYTETELNVYACERTSSCVSLYSNDIEPVWHMKWACAHNLNAVEWIAFETVNKSRNFPFYREVPELNLIRKWLKGPNQRTPNKRFWRCRMNFYQRNRKMPVSSQPPNWSSTINVRQMNTSEWMKNHFQTFKMHWNVHSERFIAICTEKSRIP